MDPGDPSVRSDDHVAAELERVVDRTIEATPTVLSHDREVATPCPHTPNAAPGTPAHAVGPIRLPVDVDRDQLEVRWKLGLLKKTKTVATGSISSISLQAGVEFSSTDSKGRSRPVASGGKACMVSAAGGSFPLTIYHDVAISREVGGLVLYQLDRMGVRPIG